jgi:hypothetical protein
MIHANPDDIESKLTPKPLSYVTYQASESVFDHGFYHGL